MPRPPVASSAKARTFPLASGLPFAPKNTLTLAARVAGIVHLAGMTQITPLTKLLLAEAKRRSDRAAADRQAEQNAVEFCKRVATTWPDLRTTFLAEITAANMLIKLNGFTEQFLFSDSAIREADKLASCDIDLTGPRRARLAKSMCAYTGDLRFQHFIDGQETFKVRHVMTNVFELDRTQVQEMLALLFCSTPREPPEDE
jgi:hypothetical protein